MGTLSGQTEILAFDVFFFIRTLPAQCDDFFRHFTKGNNFADFLEGEAFQHRGLLIRVARDALRKTGKMVKKLLAWKNQGIRNFAENQGKIREFQKILSLEGQNIQIL